MVRLQLFNWVLKDKKRRVMLKTSVESNNIDISVWGLDPTLNIALQFALAERSGPSHLNR